MYDGYEAWISSNETHLLLSSVLPFHLNVLFIRIYSYVDRRPRSAQEGTYRRLAQPVGMHAQQRAVRTASSPTGERHSAFPFVVHSSVYQSPSIHPSLPPSI